MSWSLEQLKSESLRKRFVIFGVILICFWGGLRLSGVRLGINLTRSQPDWIYIILPVKEIRRGEKVAFLFQGSGYYPAGALFVKKVVGMPGDRLESGIEGVWINGERIGEVRRTDSRGSAVAPFVYDCNIPHGAYFLTADVPNSYDSRYFGLIEERQIVGKVLPLF